jgi:hypothetical protein
LPHDAAACPSRTTSHTVTRADTRRLDHQRDDIGLEMVCRADRQRMIAIGPMLVARVDEFSRGTVSKAASNASLLMPRPAI